MRDRALECRLLEEGAQLCSRVYGQSSPTFIRHVVERLALGARTYGDLDYLRKDNLIEARFEPLDSAAYPILDFQRVAPMLAAPDRPELGQYTLGVIAAAVNLDAAIHRLQRVRDELLS